MIWTCRRAAELIARSLDAPLTGWERFALRLHLALCGMCRRFRRQSRLLHAAGRQVADAGDTGATLSDAARARIKEALRRATGPPERSPDPPDHGA